MRAQDVERRLVTMPIVCFVQLHSGTQDTDEPTCAQFQDDSTRPPDSINSLEATALGFPSVFHSSSAGSGVGSSILRHRERDEAGGTQVDEFYVAHKLRIDESGPRLVVGTEYTESYSEVVTDLDTNETTTTAKSETWTVEADDEMVTVPAGTFCALRVQRTSMANTGGSTKTYWFARGAGKIREENGARLEELRSFVTP